MRQVVSSACLRFAPAAVALAALFVPTGASASGPETATCQGTSATPPVIFTSSTVTCSGAPDDTATYTFTYSPPLNCNVPTGTFNVTPAGGEFAIPNSGSGSYTAAPGLFINLTFTYTALDPTSPPPIETHKFNLHIDCPSGITTGTLSE